MSDAERVYDSIIEMRNYEIPEHYTVMDESYATAIQVAAGALQITPEEAHDGVRSRLLSSRRSFTATFTTSYAITPAYIQDALAREGASGIAVTEN